MKCLVTGSAGFIASHLCRMLLDAGHKVTGIDVFTDFYPKWIKENNLKPLLSRSYFNFLSEDIMSANLEVILKNCDYVFHLAAQAGVRSSWGESFSVYTRNNIETTQKLLEISRNSSLKRFIYASSSSVYGDCRELPMTEESLLLPYSPYGVTKLAGENLCGLYHKNYGVPTISLRFFTVYGPGQRPDMAFHKFCKASLENKEITVFGDGTQTRDFTYIDDIVRACISCMDKGREGEIYNIGGGVRRKLCDIFPILESLTGKKVKIKNIAKQKGDVPDTYALIEKAKKDLEFTPETKLQDGLLKEWNWIQQLYS
ncbi:MAG: NAD-dependent epimerase/dehydratase family protein [Candidatus Aminicenantes bacterium]|nr:NAD-dependent epimerase/dehydratase family protein [Candidatus Aminicenantes bacterium]